MLFNSSQFVIFFVLVTALYFVLPHRFRWFFLLVTSCYFYMCWEPGYIVLIAFSTVTAWISGLMISRATAPEGRKIWLVGGLVANLAVLFFFKYYNFATGALMDFFGIAGVPMKIPRSSFLLPVGISFFTFQAMSYIIDVYRREQEVERHFGYFALYISFFPQLVAGPIERAGHLLPQFRHRQSFDYDRVTNGLKLMLWGMFKKVVIADRLAQLVDHVFSAPAEYQGIPTIIATVCFSFQVFCDFSGYSDIAIGAAQVMGIKIMTNFKRPFFATSLTELWRRWHISLSTWFRDYLYVPLGGNRVSRGRHYANIITVFSLSGFWHGANWTYFSWGFLHGIFVVLAEVFRPFRSVVNEKLGINRLPRFQTGLRMFWTFFLFNVALMFFRSRSLTDAIESAHHIFRGWDVLLDPPRFASMLFSLGLPKAEFLLVFGFILLMEGVHVLQSRGSVIEWLSRRPIWFRWAVYSGLVWCIFLFGVFHHKEFIYFTF